MRVENASRPTDCAETDNVYVKFIAAGIRHFAIEAVHPPYVATLKQDRTAPDFAHCDMSHDPAYPFSPKDVVLYEDMNWRLMGHTFKAFWRPDSVAFHVGRQTIGDLHLVQLLRKVGGRAIEVLVVYPADGYWRAKPLPPPGMSDTAYGSSFLVGPVEEAGRPFVALGSIAFDPASVTFHLAFRQGGVGGLQVVEASAARTRLEVTIPTSSSTLPFAALRSMFAGESEADTAVADLSMADGRRTAMPILGFATTEATAAAFTRPVPSQHNTSAPDLRFMDFAR